MTELTRLYADSMEQIAAFDKLCFPADCWSGEDWNEMLADPRAIYYAHMDGGKIVGSIFIYNWKGERDYIKIMNIAVRADHRRQGLAKGMLDYVAAEMGALGMRRFCGETRASNKAMQRTFESCGYVRTAVEENYYNSPCESAYKYVLACDV